MISLQLQIMWKLFSSFDSMSKREHKCSMGWSSVCQPDAIVYIQHLFPSWRFSQQPSFHLNLSPSLHLLHFLLILPSFYPFWSLLWGRRVAVSFSSAGSPSGWVRAGGKNLGNQAEEKSKLYKVTESRDPNLQEEGCSSSSGWPFGQSLCRHCHPHRDRLPTCTAPQHGYQTRSPTGRNEHDRENVSACATQSITRCSWSWSSDTQKRIIDYQAGQARDTLTWNVLGSKPSQSVYL